VTRGQTITHTNQKQFKKKNKKNNIMKFTPTESIQIDEIKRRIAEFKNGNKEATMVFLGYPSEVKGLIKKGILKPDYNEVKRVLNWYSLTEFGQQII
jgi:hypothetical protein